MIPYGRQHLEEEEIAAVVAVLRSDYLTQGPKVNAFEQAVAAYCGAQFGVAVSNGTAALHLACLALGLTAGDYLWTSANTFVASANCGRYCGASIDFIDIDPQTRNLSIDYLSQKLQRAKLAGNLPKIIVVVHFAGVPCDIAAIKSLSQQYGFYIVEDAAHAMGSQVNSDTVGSCRYSDMTIFSFHPVKTITTAEGGLICCNDSQYAEKLRQLRSHGVSRSDQDFCQPSDGPWYYEQQDLGFNCRMTDIQAAIGLIQLTRLPVFIERRQQLVDRYNHLLAGLPLTLPRALIGVKPAWHLYVVELCGVDSNTFDRRVIYDAMVAKGIAVNVHYIPVHLQPYYQQLGFCRGDFPVAEAYYAQALTLPLYPDLTEQQQDYVVNALKELLL